MKTFFLSITALLVIAFADDNKLAGRWQTKPAPNGNITSAVFMPDGNFEAYINKKPFTTGKYELNNDIFSFTDNGCNGARGTYKLIFFSQNDSLRFETISDSCSDRKAGMERLIFGKVK